VIVKAREVAGQNEHSEQAKLLLGEESLLAGIFGFRGGFAA